MNRNCKQLILIPLCLLLAGVSQAKAPPAPPSGYARYIVELEQEPLAAWHARGGQDAATVTQSADRGSKSKAPERGRLDVDSLTARAYLQRLDDDFADFRTRFASRLGRELEPVHRYRFATNGFAARMTAAEASQLASMPGVKSVRPDGLQKLETDAGPAWIGADDIWLGEMGLPESRGEGMIVGVIDSGINWKHDSFKDPAPGPGGYNHQNPLGSQLGLCSDPDVLCNDKLIGVWDFVTDDEDTDEVEENTKGFDNDGHGTHVASTAVGNTSTVSFTFGLATMSGVAPNANLVSYRVCYLGDTDEGGACQNSAILAAIDQAIEDGVHAINYSIGSSAFDPWNEPTAQSFLNAVGTGIFVATSAGNSGSAASTIGAPANAPWISAVGNATHNRLFGNLVKDFSGGDTVPPPALVGASWVGNTAGIKNIVHARDYGNALCGDFTETADVPSCSASSSASNPFAPGTFNGEIVVCDRGTYGRVEKGLNVKLAGAGGYILANTDEFGKSIVADNHCLPSSHLTAADADRLRSWLASGSGHQGQITGVTTRRNSGIADVVSSSSSRGPADPPVQNVLKPNLMAPGTSILGAFAADEEEDSPWVLLGGTSMSSPHITGAAALLQSIHPDWTPSMINSALETTATRELATDSDGTIATPFEAGAGRPQLADAANVGLYLNETRAGFDAANPIESGDPGDLNLPGMANSACKEACRFTRTVTALAGGRTWTAEPSGFPAGVDVTITPGEFTLAEGASQELEIEVDLAGAGLLGNWVYGSVGLTASGMPDQRLTVAAYSTGGKLPRQWDIATTTDSGDKIFFLSNLTALPDATFTAGNPSRPESYSEALPEDPTDDDPYDGGPGVFTVLRDVPEGSLWLHAETLASTALDLDLFVGFDTNGDGIAQEDEELCSSTTPQDLELCDIFNPVPGTWWVLVQNWHESTDTPDVATLETAVIGPSDELGMTVSGQGITETDETFPLRITWNNFNAVSGEELFGAVGIGTDRDHPNNVGIIPVRFSRTAIKAGSTLPLMDGRMQRMALRGSYTHRYVFIDVPAGADSLTVSAEGADETQSNGLQIELKRIGFDTAFDAAPYVPAAPDGSAVASASGGNGSGPEVTVSGGQLSPGRWYVVLRNNNATEASVSVRADVEFSGGPGPVHGGLWQPISRPDISQGFDYAAGDSRAMLWYTYDEQGMPTWYLAAGVNPPGQVWTADLLRFTNDGERQQAAVAGQLSVTTLAEEDVVFSWHLFGSMGSDRMIPTSPHTCPQVGESKASYTGIWFRGIDGLGGASVLVNGTSQGQVHYLYDSLGEPRWLLGAVGVPLTDQEIILSQFSGFCPTCVGEVSSTEVGLLTSNFTSETTGQWTLDYSMAAPLRGDVQRGENIVKLTGRLECD
jgi:subtilisin family serine protease